MTGPEHYRESERLLAESQMAARDRATPGWLTADELVDAAQVHATLALVAVTAQQRTEGPDGADSLCDFNPDWAKAVGVQ